MTARPGWTTAKPVVWLKAIQDISLGPKGRAVAAALALSADKADGKNARPGLSRLQWAAEVSRGTVVTTLASLEAMGLIYCESKSTGRGNASVYWLTLHDELDRYSKPSFEDWLKATRPADSSPKGSAGEPFRGVSKGSVGEPFSAVKGQSGTPKGSKQAPERVSGGTAPGSTTREEHTSSVLRTGAALRASPAENPSPNRNGKIRVTSDRDDLEALETELEGLLGPDAVEMSTITGMLADGRDPHAVINKIIADRRSHDGASNGKAEHCCPSCQEPVSQCKGHGNCPGCGYLFAGYAQPMPSGLCAWCDDPPPPARGHATNPAPRRETA